MSVLKFDQIKKAWAEISRSNQETSIPPDFELTLYKKIFNRLHPGPYYYYIFNVFETKMEFVSPEITDIIGFTQDFFTANLVLDHLHPEDLNRFIEYEQKVSEFFIQLPVDKILKYKVSYDYRLRCLDGSYKWILQQVSTIQSSEQGSVIRVLGVHTDISFLKTDNKPSGLSFLGLDGEPSYYNVLLPNANTAAYNSLTKREKEILYLLSIGKSSFEIACQLFISKETVSTHRKNIIKKLGVKSFAELLRLAIANNEGF